MKVLTCTTDPSNSSSEAFCAFAGVAADRHAKRKYAKAAPQRTQEVWDSGLSEGMRRSCCGRDSVKVYNLQGGAQ